jgi:hypothetical protein
LIFLVFRASTQTFLTSPKNRHPERSASQICGTTESLSRGVEGPRRRSFVDTLQGFLMTNYIGNQKVRGARHQKAPNSIWQRTSSRSFDSARQTLRCATDLGGASLRMTIFWGIKDFGLRQGKRYVNTAGWLSARLSSACGDHHVLLSVHHVGRRCRQTREWQLRFP